MQKPETLFGVKVWGLLASLSSLRSVRFGHELALLGWGLGLQVSGFWLLVTGNIIDISIFIFHFSFFILFF
jgi:hypothetical protein